MPCCKSCNEEFESDFGFDTFFCDEWCARSSEPFSSVKPLQLVLLEQRLLGKPRQQKEQQGSKISKLFSFYYNAIKNRGRDPNEVEVAEYITHTDEYIRLRLKFQADEITVTGLKKV
jgi:hypothetical protein